MDVEEMKLNIAKNLRSLRKERKISQEKLTKTIGEEYISLRSYKSYESGTEDFLPSLDKIAILANYFDCPIDYIVYGKKCMYSDSHTKKDELTRLMYLLDSLVLTPVKEKNPDSSYFGKYLFLAFDNDVSLLMDKREALANETNIAFYKGEGNKTAGLEDYLKLINEISDLDEDWSVSEKRFRAQLIRSNIDPNEYFYNSVTKVMNERKAYSLMEKKKK